MDIIVLGTRGIPGIQGGVETHCEELYPYIAQIPDIKITVIVRSCYVKDRNLVDYKGVRVKVLYAPKSKVLEAIVHSLLAILYAAFKRPDIVHIHGIGPNLVTPLARLFGLKVIMTHHGPDYERKKWGAIAKLFLKAGEWAGVRFSNKIIVISEEINKILAKKYKRQDGILIPNGVVNCGTKVSETFVLEKFGLRKYSYLFALGRFVPEKGFDYLIRAFQKSNLDKQYKLVIAGDADHETGFSRKLRQQANEAGIILTGFIKGETLAQIFSNCGLFILPSFYEGLPIALLEAMSYGLPILATNIPANLQVKLPDYSYFSVGNEAELAYKIREYFQEDNFPERINYNMRDYNWENIANNTHWVYNTI